MTRVFFSAALLALLAILLQPMSGAVVKLEISPSSINPGLTKSMTLRCSVENDVLPVTAPPIIGRRAVDSNKSVTHNADISHVMSIIVTRQNGDTGVNETVASVSPYDLAEAMVDQDLLQVEGETDLPSSSREMGYLKLTWDHPVNQQSGTYTCEVFALNSVLHSEYISLSVEVDHRTATVEDLALFIASMDRYVDKLEKKVEDMEKETAILRSEAENRTLEYQGQIDYLINTTKELSQFVGNGTGQNIQAGYLDCSYSSSSTNLERFDVPFQKVPKIIFTLSTFDYRSSSYGNTIEHTLQSSSTTEFSMNCKHSQYNYRVAWIAFEDPNA